MSNRHVGIVTGAHLCRNPRVVKEAAALVAAGYAVTVISPQWSTQLRREDQLLARTHGFEHLVPVDLSRGGYLELYYRLRRRVGREIVKMFGAQDSASLGYGLRELKTEAIRIRADLLIGHQEVGLVIACELQASGVNCGVDLEDWYSEDLLASARKYRPIRLLKRLEGQALSSMAHCTTTSEAMASAMATEYACRKPTCVYNSFDVARSTDADVLVQDRRFPDRPSLYWVSQTIGPGRGLEELMAALTRVDRPIELCLRGQIDPSYQQNLLQTLGDSTPHRVTILNLVPAEELGARSAQHDIGLALEESEPLSRDLTITNKLFHGLQAGLAVVATRTTGQEEAARIAVDGVQLVEENSAAALGEVLNRLLRDPRRLEEAKAASRLAAAGPLAWTTQAERLVESVSRALQSKP